MWRDYRDCPARFNLKYIQKKPSMVPRTDYFKLYGFLTEKFFQMFCNSWRYRTPYMPPEYIKQKLEILWQPILNSSIVDWSSPVVKETEGQIFEKVFKDVCAIMDSNNQNYFLSTKSEIEVSVSTQNNHFMTGRIDFIKNDPIDHSITIFDGKGTEKAGKNIDPDQLLFYTLLYFFQSKKLPVSLGFFYYRFNTFDPMEINMDILNEFRARLSLTLKALSSEDFKANPGWKTCKYCDYRTGCPEYIQFQSDRRKINIIDIESNETVVDIGL